MCECASDTRPLRLGANLNCLVVAAADHEPRVKHEVADHPFMALRVDPVKRLQALARPHIPKLYTEREREREIV
jgi:hypothetical protein